MKDTTQHSFYCLFGRKPFKQKGVCTLLEDPSTIVRMVDLPLEGGIPVTKSKEMHEQGFSWRKRYAELKYDWWEKKNGVQWMTSDSVTGAAGSRDNDPACGSYWWKIWTSADAMTQGGECQDEGWLVVCVLLRLKEVTSPLDLSLFFSSSWVLIFMARVLN